jgi:hypothetical protein
MHKELVTVVIPIHLEEPTDLEKISLDQTLAVLANYPITFMAPTGLNTAWYEAYCQGKATIFIERFQWKGHVAFCRLMLDPAFYQRFASYEYMLICHLDAFVFRDELMKWCNLGYDYIGGVIYSSVFWQKETLWRRVTGFTNPEYLGNGGFALKKISGFYHMTSKFRRYVNFFYWLNKVRNRAFYDDLFLANHFPKLHAGFRIAPKVVAQRFGADYERWPEEDLPFTNEDNATMPFGVHGWIQHHQDYWQPCIRRFGYAI